MEGIRVVRLKLINLQTVPDRDCILFTVCYTKADQLALHATTPVARRLFYFRNPNFI
jgi:hypothetical protein